jgi:predicted AlkP superfamily phosphohydrolase/phosphomutase
VQRRLLLLGLDGATFDVLLPLVEAGRLPVLAELIRRGSHATLASTIPPITPTAWTTVFTGKNPGKHGIYDFQELDPATYARRPVHVDRHREKTLWELLGEGGRRSIVLDVPFTYPPRPLNGLMITGYATPRTPGTAFTYPADLTRSLPAELHDQIRVALPRHRFDRSQAFVDEWRAIMGGRRRLLVHLARHEPWNFLFAVFSITDNMAHVFWTFLDPAHPNYERAEAPAFREALFGAYEQCDAALGELLAAAGDDANVLVMSDHGFGSVYTRQFLFERLAAGGFLTYSGGGDGALNVRGRLLRSLLAVYTRAPALRELVKGLRPERQALLGRTLQQTGLLPGNRAVDTARTSLLPTDFGLQLWVNSSDRFARGPVDPAEKETLLAAAREHLLAAQTPDRQPVVAATYRGDELYQGPAASAGPDLVVELANFYRAAGGGRSRNPHLEGGHTPDGILVAAGPDVKAGAAVDAPGLVDLAPTVLHLLGEAVPPDMDGRVLAELEAAPSPVRQGTAAAVYDERAPGNELSAAEATEVEEQLRQLGYL